MEPYLAELSRTIEAAELGRRIRNARIAAEMTQAQVVGDEVSAAYLSRIEDGQRRPEAGLLERMATRMGTTLEALLLGINPNKLAETELAIDHAELALVSGDTKTALARTKKVLADLSEVQSPQLVRRARYIRAGALEVSGDLDGAILVLEELTATPSPDASWLRALIALSRCYRDSGDFNKAIAVGTRTAGLIEKLGVEGLTEAIQLTVTVAAAYHRLGDTGEAMRTCLRALKAAEKYNSPIAKASAYWNASTIQAATGATEGAIEMARKALVLFELGDDNRNLAKLRAEIANLQLAADPPEPAAALATLARADQELLWSGASTWELAFMHLIRGRARLQLGELEAAEESVRSGIDAAPEQAPFLHASAARITGQIAAARGRTEEARTAYREAIHLLTGAGSDRDAAQLWFELADLLTEVGDTEGALQAFRSAGASTGLRARASTVAPTTAT